jgi:N-acetylglutamate synthase-like GNAT family acetyltransferase
VKTELKDIRIRNDLRPGDLGYVIHLHGLLYGREYGYGVKFEIYVAKGLGEFYESYDPARDRVWICEHGQSMVGFLLLLHRGSDCAQLRYFLIRPEYRGIGLGKHLMQLFMDQVAGLQYKTVYLWTTDELAAAASLYTRHGFGLTEEKESDVFGKPLRERRYDWVAPASGSG